MEPGTGDRGVSEVMGFILVFGMLVLSFTIYQGIVVPDQNRQAEFEHNQNVQGQLQDLRNAIVSTSATGSGQAVSVKLGASYPTRALAQNLGISAGSIQTTDAGGIRIDNVEALDEETKDYLNGSVGPFETKSIRYHPTYSFYSSAPVTTYENSLTFNRFPDANLTITDQVVIDGRRITLIAINGNLSRAERDTVSISTEAISTSSNRIGVRNTPGEKLNVTIPTELSADDWEEILADEMIAGGQGNVENVAEVPGEDAVNVTMKQGVTYELRMAKIGVGDLTAEEDPKYITDVQGDGVSVAENSTQKLVVEVRDRFNNPVSNVTVTSVSGTPDEGSLSSTSETTDSDGKATFTYEAPEDGGLSDVVTLGFGPSPYNRNQTVDFQIEVVDSDGSGGGEGGGGGGGNINPADSKSLVLRSSTISAGGDCGSNCVRITLENLDTSNSKSIDEMRFNFYAVDSQGGAGITLPESIKVNDDDSLLLEKGGDYNTDVSIPIGSGDSVSFDLHFYVNDDGTSSFTQLDEGDFFVVSVLLDDGSTSATYFVAPTH